jgi:DNA modification methylase
MDNRDASKPLQLETLVITDLTPDPDNARKHDTANLNAIMGSLEQFGQRKPIVVDKANVVVAGNGTLEAAKRLGWTSIQAVRVPADWTADRIKAFALADNRTAELATWDKGVLDTQLAELDELGWQLEGIGFEYQAPDDLDNIVEDTLPADIETRSKTGQVWQLGAHRLMVGDSTKSADVLKLMNGEQADLIITDPPYNVDYHGGTDDSLTIANDAMSDGDFKQFLNDAYARMFEITKEGAPIYVFHADSSGHHFRNEFIATGWLLKQCLIWVKNSFVMGRQDYHWQHEPILYGWKPGAGHTWYGARNKATVIDDSVDISKLGKTELLEIVRGLSETTTVVREDKPKRNGEHPTMKPINLLARLMSNSSKRGDLVVDTFGGSGSTLITAEQLGRRCNIIEFDPRYADVIIARWEKFTNQEAELING